MDNIILIGMPTSGKSTIGVLLAKTMGMGYIDSDLVIQSRLNQLLSEIIKEKGLDEFLKIEEKINSELISDRCVIATGGSVIYGSKAMEHLKKMGRVVYLQLSYEEIARRLSDMKGRGVAIKDGYTLRDLYNERIPLYEKYADITVCLDGKNISECLDSVRKKLRQRES